MSAETTMGNPETVVADRLPAPETNSRPARNPALVRIRRGLTVAAVAIGTYLTTTHFVVQSVTVVGLSMNPTLEDSHRYLLNRWVYWVREPRRTEVVVLRDPADNSFVVKRVVAMPGDSVSLKDGEVFVNGARLDEPYLKQGTPTFTSSKLREQTFLCGKDQYFVLGDNRNNSVDSRAYGPVPRSSVLGMIIQ